MAFRFPNLPPRVIPGARPSLDHEVYADDADWRAVAPVPSLHGPQQQAEGAEMLPSPDGKQSPANSSSGRPRRCRST